jgi:hypothetical protein
MRNFLISLAILLVGAGSLGAQEQAAAKKLEPSFPAYSLRGGGWLAPTDSGLSASIGFPHATVAYYFAVRPGFEVAPFANLFYSLNTSDNAVGDALGAEFRYQVYHDDKLRLALYAEPAVVLAYHPDTAFGLRVGAPGLVVSYQILDHGFLVGGVKASPLIITSPATALSLPIVVSAGGEFQLHQAWNLFVDMGLGPDFRKVEGAATTTDLYVNAVFGVTRRF